MLLFIAIATSVLWISGCLLGLALGAMLARADGRDPPRPASAPRPRAARRLLGGAEHALPTA